MNKAAKVNHSNFIDTEIGSLPEDWGIINIGDVFEVQQGKAMSAKHRQGISPYPFLRTSNVLWGKVDLTSLDYMDFNDKERDKLELLPDDLLICEGGETGRTAVWRGEQKKVFIQNHVYRVRRKDNNIEPLFVMYWMQAALTMLNLYTGQEIQTTIANLSSSRLKLFKIPRPPIFEQRTIAHILSTIQQAIEITDRVINATQELKKSLMQHLFTYGPVSLEEAENVPLKEIEVGLVPEHWDIACLRDLTLKCSQTDPRNTPNSKIKYVDVSGISNQTLRIEDYKKFYGKDSPSRARKKIHSNDVIIATVRPYLKRIALVPECLDGELCSTAFCVLRALTQKIYPIFLFYCVAKNDFISRASTSQRGSSYPAITDKDVLNQPIPLPSLADQKKITNILKSLDTKIQAEIKNKTVLQSLFNSMLHHLMTGKLRVNDLDLELPEVVEQ